MQHSTSGPRVALAVNLGAVETDGSPGDSAQRLAHLLDSHRLPATWAVRQAEQAIRLQDRLSAVVTYELALAIDDRWSAAASMQTFQKHVQRQLAAFESSLANPVTVVLGSHHQLRTRASALASLGIGAVLSTEADLMVPRSLACGLWGLPTTLEFPTARRLGGLIPPRRASLRRLTRIDASFVLILIHATGLDRRNLRSLDKLLGHIAWAASRQELSVATVGQLAAELARQNRVKPQRSILRVAA